jgi:ribonuclease P protein component
MFSRPYRLRSQLEIKRVYRRGRVQHSPNFSLTYLPNYQAQNRLTVVVGTKVSKKSVQRNKMRRRVRAAIRELWPQLKTGYDMIVIVKKDLSKLEHSQLKQQLLLCLSHSQIITKP